MNGALDAQTLAILIASVISPLVGLITKWSAPPWVKGFLNLALTTLESVLVTANLTSGLPWEKYVVIVAQAWAVAIAAHYGFYKPTSASGSGWFQHPDTVTGSAGLALGAMPHQQVTVEEVDRC